MRKAALAIAAICVIATATITLASYVPEQKRVVPIVAEDCLPYDVGSLQIVNEGEKGWLLTDGRSRMLVLDNKEDAEAALALAQRHKAHCFIGRNNRRPNRCSYIVEYWK